MTIVKGDMTIFDSNDNLIENKDGITCGCNNPVINITMHIDGVDFCQHKYVCENCGNNISVIVKRDEEEEW